MDATTLTTETVDLHADLVIPSAPPDTVSSWRRMVLAVDPDKVGAYALSGRELRAGTAYRLPHGALVVSCDKYADRRDIILWRAETGGLVEVKSWSQKAPLGKRVTAFISQHLPCLDRHALAGFAALEDLPNRWDSWCSYCREPIPAGEGRLLRGGSKTTVAHRGPCPPRLPMPNQWPGRCASCDGWIDAGDGIVVAAPGWTPPIQAPWTIRHPAGCPASPEPAPIIANRWPDWCHVCGEMTEAGEGWYEPGLGVRHDWPCPEATVTCQTWRAYRPERAGEPEQGAAAWTRITVREGECPIPPSAPGFQVLAEDLVQAVMVVLDWRKARGGYLARVRTATPAEAGALLARRIGFVPDAVPDALGFKADFALERFGAPGAVRGVARMAWVGDPWVAEITGRRRGYGGFERDFLRPKRDYTNANSKGTRGVRCHWTLAVNRVYEAHCPESWNRSRRVFLRATPDGDVREIGNAEVEAWLDWAAGWVLALGGDLEPPERLAES